MKKKNSKHGFTMTELLGAIIIIGILATIGILSVAKILDNAHKKFDESQGKILNQAGQNYFSDNKKSLPTVVGEKKIIYLSDLINNNYIDKIYGYDKKPFNLNSSFVTVTKLKNGKYKYEYRLCYDNEGKQCVGNGNNVINKTNNSKIEFIKYDKFNSKDDNTFYTNNYVEVTVGITDNVKKITGYKYEIQKNNSQVKTSEIINVNETNYLEKVISLSKKDYKDGQYKVKVTSYDIDGATKSSTSKLIFIDTKPPTCTLQATGTKTNDWYNISPTISFKNKQDDSGSGISDYGLLDSTSISYNNKPSGMQIDETMGTKWYGYVKDKAGNEGNCNINIKLDRTEPICTLTTSTESYNDTGWWNDDVGIMLEERNRKDQGLVQSGIDNQFTVTTSSTTPSSFDNLFSDAQKEETSGINWYGYVKDRAGNVGKCNIEIKLDRTAPTCDVSTTSPPNGKNDWYITNADLFLTNQADSGSGINYSITGLDTSDSLESYNGQTTAKQGQTTIYGTTWYGHVKDIAGNSGICAETVKVDATPPTCSIRAERGADYNTWYNRSVDLYPNILSAGSPCGGKGITASTEGANIPYSISIESESGLTGSCQTTINLDTIKPTCSTIITTDPSHKKNGWWNDEVDVSLKVEDNGGSGVSQKGIDKGNSCPSTSYNNKSSVTITGEGRNKCAKGIVKDNAGNTNSCNVEFKVDRTAPTVAPLSNGNVGCGINNYHSTYEIHIPIVDSYSGYSTGNFVWETGKNDVRRYLGSNVECIASSKNGQINFKVSDTAGNHQCYQVNSGWGSKGSGFSVDYVGASYCP